MSRLVRLRSFGVSGVLALALLSGGQPALAASDEEKAGARAAAMEGVQAFQEQRWNDVVDLFTRAEALVHSPVHLLYLGRGNAQIGKLVLAREALMRASREKIEPDSPAAFERARDSAKEELVALEPRIPYLTLKLEGAPASAVTVTMDGVKVPAPLIGLSRPVDPGEHKFEVSGPGVTAAPLVVTIGESEKKTAILSVQVSAQPAAPAGGAAPGEAPAGGAAAGGAGSGAPGKDQGPAEQGPNNGLRIGSYASFGVGAVGLGLGIAFGLKAKSKRSEADDYCNSQGCPESARSKIEDADAAANSANTLAIVGFALGGVGIAAGTTLFILSMPKASSESPPSTAYVRPWVGLGSAGVSGRF